MDKDVYPLFTIMNECKFDAPLLLSVFLVLLNHTGPFLENKTWIDKVLGSSSGERSRLWERGETLRL